MATETSIKRVLFMGLLIKAPRFSVVVLNATTRVAALGATDVVYQRHPHRGVLPDRTPLWMEIENN